MRAMDMHHAITKILRAIGIRGAGVHRTNASPYPGRLILWTVSLGVVRRGELNVALAFQAGRWGVGGAFRGSVIA